MDDKKKQKEKEFTDQFLFCFVYFGRAISGSNGRSSDALEPPVQLSPWQKKKENLPNAASHKER